MERLSGKRYGALVAAVASVAVAIAYSNSLRVGFYFDDSYGIAENPAIRSLRNVPRFFVDPFLLTTVRENVDVRPVLQATYALNYAISGLSPWSWHALNLLLHLFTAWLVFLIVRDHLWWPREDRGPTGSARIPAAAAALFFALAPVNSGAVTYMWARSALLCTLLYLVAFRSHARERIGLAALFYLLALLTKTIAITFPLLALIWAVIERNDLRRQIKPLVVYAVVTVAYLAYRAAILPPWADQARHEAYVTPWIWLMSGWPAYLYYLRLFVWPDALSVDHDFAYNVSFWTARTLFPLAGVVLWLSAGLLALRRKPVFAFATAWYFLTLAPESTLYPLSEVVNDHRPYLASALGLSLLLAWALRGLAFPIAPRAFAPAALVLCLVAIPALRHRNAQWQDALELWRDAAEKGPNNGRAAMNAGREFMARGRLVEAHEWFERARRTVPEYPYLHMNLSALDAREGMLEAALSDAREGVRTGPNLSLTHVYLGVALERLSRNNEAAEAFRRALELDPRNAEAQAHLNAQMQRLMDQGLEALRIRHEPKAAIAVFRRVLGYMPTHYGATYQLAVALDASGQRAQARAVWSSVSAMAAHWQDHETAERARTRLAAAP